MRHPGTSFALRHTALKMPIDFIRHRKPGRPARFSSAMPAYADYPHAERRIVVELVPPSPHLHQSERPFFEPPVRFTLSFSAKIVVIFQVSEVHVMRRRIARSF